MVGERTQGRGGGKSAMLKDTPGMPIPKEALHKSPKVKSSLGCLQVFIYVVRMVTERLSTTYERRAQTASQLVNE